MWEVNTEPSPIDGTLIRYGIRRGAGRRVVLFINGRSEWIEKYDSLPDELDPECQDTWITFDHRGQGASGGLRAHVANISEYVADLEHIVKLTCDCSPYAIVAHSMGALIALVAVLQGRLAPQALVMSAPLLLMPRRQMPRWCMHLISSLYCRLGYGQRYAPVRAYGFPPTLANNPFTSDAGAFARIESSPYVLPKPTLAWVRAMLLATDQVFDPKNLATLATPCLLFSGTDERIVDPEGFSLWTECARRYSKAPVWQVTIPTAKHEIFNERQEVKEYVRGVYGAFLRLGSCRA